MNSKEEELLLQELKEKNVSKETIHKIEGLVSGSNGWDRLRQFFNSDKVRENEIYQEVISELLRDQCCGYPTHMICFIEELMRIVDKYEGQAYREIYSDIKLKESCDIDNVIESLQKIVNRMDYKRKPVCVDDSVEFSMQFNIYPTSKIWNGFLLFVKEEERVYRFIEPKKCWVEVDRIKEVTVNYGSTKQTNN